MSKLIEALLQRLENPNLLLNRHGLFIHPLHHLRAWILAPAGKLHQPLNFLQRQAHGLSFLNEVDGLSSLRIEDAIARMRSRRFGQ